MKKDFLPAAYPGGSPQIDVHRPHPDPEVTQESLQRRVEQLQSLYQLSDSVSRAEALETIYGLAIQGLLRTVGADRASILLFDPDGVMRFKAWDGLSEEYRRAVEGHSPWLADAVDPEPIFVSNVDESEALDPWKETILAEGIRALGFIPLSEQGRLLGKFMIYYDAPHRFSDEEIQGALMIARQVAFAIERKRKEEKLALYHEIFSRSNDAIAIIDVQGRYLEQNEAHRRLIGYENEELEGQTPVIHLGEEGFNAIAQALSDMSNYRGEAVSRIKTGEQRDIDLSAFTVRDDQGQPICFVGIKRDITERKRMEEALRRVNSDLERRVAERTEELSEANRSLQRSLQELRQAEDERRSVMTHARCILWSADIEFRDNHYYWDFHISDEEAAQQVLPLDVRLPDLPYFEAWYRSKNPDDRPRMDQNSRHALAQGIPSYTQEFRCTNKFGVELWLEEKVTLVPRGKNRWRTVGVCTDITERKRVEISLQQSEARYRSVVENVREVIFQTDSEGKWTFLNPAWAELTGYSPTESMGTVFLDYVHPDDREGNVEQFKPLIEGEKDYCRHEVRYLRKDGGYRWVVVHARLIHDESGKAVGTTGTLSDITERRRLEEEHQRVLQERAARAQAEAAEQRAAFLAEAGQILAHSLDYEETLKQVAALAVPQLADWCFVDLIQEDESFKRVAVSHANPDKSELASKLQRLYLPNPSARHGTAIVARTGKPQLETKISDSALVEVASDEEHLQMLRDVRMRSYLCVPLVARDRTLGTISLITSDSGRVYTREDLAFAEELALRAAIAIDNARLYHEVQRADRVKDEFLAMLAHELRNPLAPIFNAVQIMRLRGSNDPDLQRAHGMVERQVRHMTRLLDDLLDVSRITRGKVRLCTERHDLRQVLNSVLEDLQKDIEKAGLTPYFRLPDSPVWVRGDATRLSQVFGNLILNACKFTNPGGSLTLTLDAGDGFARVAVKDTGIGIDKEMLPHIFETFIQADRSLDRSRGGLGLGLALVQGLVKMHGGSVEVHSEGIGAGAEFRVLLPLDMQPVKESPPPVTERSPKKDLGILVIDDNRDVAESLCDLLQLLGHRVEAAFTGNEGLERVQRFRPDVVLCDLGLPGMDGYAVAREVRRRRPELRLIAVSGYGQEEARQKSKQAGFDHHLVKPVDPEELQRLLEEVN